MAKHTFIIVLILIIAGALCKDKNEGEINVDPCIFTLCIENSTCLSYPDPSTCNFEDGSGIESCEKRAICVPTHSSARYCGFGGVQVQLVQLVQVECFTQPCPPLLMCVPINPYHPDIPVPLTRGGGTKYSKFVIKDNHFYHIQRQNNKGRPQPSKLTSVVFNRN